MRGRPGSRQENVVVGECCRAGGGWCWECCSAPLACPVPEAATQHIRLSVCLSSLPQCPASLRPAHTRPPSPPQTVSPSPSHCHPAEAHLRFFIGFNMKNTILKFSPNSSIYFTLLTSVRIKFCQVSPILSPGTCCSQDVTSWQYQFIISRQQFANFSDISDKLMPVAVAVFHEVIKWRRSVSWYFSQQVLTSPPSSSLLIVYLHF